METESKHLRNHHLPCLSGLSQAPLINANDQQQLNSERSTPISAHSLPFNSSLNNHQFSTPLPANPVDSFFFPQLPARTSVQHLHHHHNHHHHHHHQHQQQQQQQQQLKTQISLDSNNRSPRSLVDVNMNNEQERNRENSLHFQQHNQNHSPRLDNSSINGRFQNPQKPLLSPLRLPTKSITDINESQQVRHLVDLHPSRKSRSNSTEEFTWVQQQQQQQQQDENYHLYHEPIDPDELTSPLIDPSPTSNATTEPQNSWLTSKISLKNSLDLIDQCLTPFARSSISATTSANSNNNNNSSQIKSGVSSAKTTNTPPTSFVDKRDSNHPGKDVSADIYLCYVSLRSNERANHRSRSYHGPKNTNSINQVLQLPYTKDATKNLSSTSVVDIPISPTNFTSTMIRDHCFRELIETESNYVHALNMIITCFAKPLEPFLKREESQLIFGNIKYFHHIHSNFQADLVKAALRSYNKEVTSLTSSARSSSNQASSNPTTPTTLSNNIFSQHFLAPNSPLPSPITRELPLSPSPLTSSGSPATLTSTTTAIATSAAATTTGATTISRSSFKISSCFLNIKEKFLKYGEYCATLSKAQALLDDLTSKNEDVAAQLDRCQQDANEGKFKLRDLLSLPMQRILKYHLLLAQLIKNTNATNDDYQGLRRAHETMVDLGMYINEVKRDTEAIQILDDIEQSISGLNLPSNTQLSDYGRLVTDGPIKIIVPYDQRIRPSHDSLIKLPHDTKLKQKRKERYVFVFDKVMLICKEKSGLRDYQFKEALKLSDFELDTNPPISTEITSKHAVKEKRSRNFNLVRCKDKTVYSFYAKTSEDKMKWVEAIQKAMDNIKPAACRNHITNHDFLMHTFDKASSCDHCGKLLLGLYYQGYRCRTCFSSAHKKCLASIRPCGPALPPRPSSNTLLPPRARGVEPSSPSVRSNCSDEGQIPFITFPSSNSSSTLCVDATVKNEYSNIEITTNKKSEPFIHNSHSTTFTQDNLSRPASTKAPHENLTVSSPNGRSYVNFILNDYPWFCGRLEREVSENILKSMQHGTFLVRVSPKHNGSYIISLNYNSQVKHMRIYVSKDNQFYLSQNRYFKSVVELVSWYEKNSLVENFLMLDARLMYPYKSYPHNN